MAAVLKTARSLLLVGSNPTPSALRTMSAPAPSPGPEHAGGPLSPRPICGPARAPAAWSRRGIPGRTRLLVRLLRPAAAERPSSAGDHRAGRRAPAILAPFGAGTSHDNDSGARIHLDRVR